MSQQNEKCFSAWPTCLIFVAKNAGYQVAIDNFHDERRELLDIELS